MICPWGWPPCGLYTSVPVDDPKTGPPFSDDDLPAPEAGGGDWRDTPAAIYGLEHPVICGHCRQEIHQLYVVRLYRIRANFVSSLPRSGRVIVCPKCRTILPGELGGVL